ncbi:MAG: PEP-CTERM sorting domain-containing protein [Planctomycetales bacterium]|nr:PEP-CTERM sorting domain-containing protein [Planctomycetales bacterium]
MKRTLIVLACLAIVSPIASATLFTYGDYEGKTVWFEGVGEDTSSPVAGTEGWFGAPVDPAGLGDSLYFTPNAFSVQGVGGGIDYKNGQIWFTVDAKAGRDIDSIEIEEYGDWSLFGLGTNNTYVSVAGSGFLTVQRVEYNDVESVVNLTIPVTMMYKKISNTYWDDGIFKLVEDGVGTAGWEGELKVDIDAALVAAGVSGKATQVYFTMDNTLFAMSETGSVAQIEKKGLGGFIVTIPQIPEPATLIMMGLGGLLLARKK